MAERLMNYIDGAWRAATGSRHAGGTESGHGRALGATVFSTPAEVDQAAQAAATAVREWRRTPATQRIQYLFKLKTLMEEHFEDLARSITIENGKVMDEPAARCAARLRMWKWPAASP